MIPRPSVSVAAGDSLAAAGLGNVLDGELIALGKLILPPSADMIFDFGDTRVGVVCVFNVGAGNTSRGWLAAAAASCCVVVIPGRLISVSREATHSHDRQSHQHLLARCLHDYLKGTQYSNLVSGRIVHATLRSTNNARSSEACTSLL